MVKLRRSPIMGLGTIGVVASTCKVSPPTIKLRLSPNYLIDWDAGGVEHLLVNVVIVFCTDGGAHVSNFLISYLKSLHDSILCSCPWWKSQHLLLSHLFSGSSRGGGGRMVS